MNIIKAFVLKYRALPYLALFLIIFIFILISRYSASPYSDWSNNLLVEMIGALLLLGSFDLLQSWRREQQEIQERKKIQEAEEKEALRIRKYKQTEADFSLKIAYELILPYASKYLQYTKGITTDNLVTKGRELNKIEFIDLIHFYQPSEFFDSTTLVYHQYFDQIPRLLDVVHLAIFNLKPSHHYDIIELLKEFSQNNEQAHGLYKIFQRVEENNGIKAFHDEMKKFFNDKRDVDDLATRLLDPLYPYTKVYKLTLSNVNTLFKLSDLNKEKLGVYLDEVTGNLRFDFADPI